VQAVFDAEGVLEVVVVEVVQEGTVDRGVEEGGPVLAEAEALEPSQKESVTAEEGQEGRAVLDSVVVRLSPVEDVKGKGETDHTRQEDYDENPYPSDEMIERQEALIQCIPLLKDNFLLFVAQEALVTILCDTLKGRCILFYLSYP